ncbi:MAG TPA: PEP-CTERM sorting domain-containing protein [Tepidisphaeraceae bacterium]
MSFARQKGRKSSYRIASRATLGLAASLAAGALVAQTARADGTATATLPGADRTWDSTGVWTWVGDTGSQVYPGDGKGAGAGTEDAIAKVLYSTRTLNVSTNVATLGGFTIGSFTLQQTQNDVTRGLNVNYQGALTDNKFVLNTNLIQHIDAPGVVSGGGSVTGLNNALIFNAQWALNANNLVLNANTASNTLTNSALNYTGNIAIKFDDSDVTFNSLTLQGAKAVEFENNNASRTAVWNMNGDVNLNGTGQLRLRYWAQGADGDSVQGTTGLGKLVANAPSGYANAFFERATGTVINRFAFTDTVLNSDLFYDPNNAHVSLGNIQVNGKRTAFIWDSTAALTANGSDYANITGDADSELLIAGTGTWTFDKNVQSTMLGKVGVYDYQANFNANGAMGATAVADKYGMIVLGVTPTATDKFEIRDRGIIRGNSGRLAALDTASNITLAPGAIIAHETLGATADTTTTIANLGTDPKYYFGLGADTPATSSSFDITVGPGTPWAGIASDRAARRWNNGVITANSDFTLRSGRFISGGTSLILGNGTNAGALSVVNNTGNAGRVNVTIDGRVDFDDDQSNYSNVNFIIGNQTEARFYRDAALGGATATVMPGGFLIASSAQNGGSTAFNGDILIKSGGGLQINSKDLAGNNAGLNGTGTITREPNIILWLNHSEALNGSQFGPANVQDGDLIRVEADDITRFNELPGGVTVQVKNANRKFGPGFTLDGGALVTDHASRTADRGAGLNQISVGPKGATFAAATPTLTYVDPRMPALLYNGSGNVGGAITGTSTLTVNLDVQPTDAATAAGTAAAPITIGSATPIDGLNMMGSVLFNGVFNYPGSVNKISNADLIFNGGNSHIGGDLIAGGAAPGLSPNVKFGNNATTLTDGIVSGDIIGGSLILGGGTKTDLNIATPGNNGLALADDNRLDVNLKIVLDGAMSPDGRRIYVDRRDATAGSVGLINLDKVTIRPGAFVSIDEATTDVRIKNATVLGDFTTDQGAGDAFEFENLSPATPVNVNVGVVSSIQGANISDIGLLGTISSNVTFNNVRGRERFENGVVFNGTINTQNVPTGGDSWVRVLAGQNGAGFASGTGQINIGGTANGSGGIGNGEDLYVYINDSNDAPITNVFPVRVNILANQAGTIVSDRNGTDLTLAGKAEVTNIHLQQGSTLYVGQNQDTTLTTDLVLEGNATVKKNDGDATASQVFVRNVSGPFDLAVETGSLSRSLSFNGNATNNRVVVGQAGNSAIALLNGASLPAVVLGNQGVLTVNDIGSVAQLTSTNASPNAVTVVGILQIRPAANAAAATTSKLATLPAISGAIDLGDANRLAIDYAPGLSPITTVRGQIVVGYNGGAWNGAGSAINSSSAAADSRLAIGYAEAFELLGPTGGTFGSETVDGDAILVRTTLAGDADLSGNVDFNDLVRLAQNYNNNVAATTESWWYNGDFNYDGMVDFNDLVKLAQNYNAALPSGPIAGAPVNFEPDLARAFAAVPEPGTLSLFAAFGLAALSRRRRRTR